MFGFIKKAVSSVAKATVSVTKVVAQVAKPVATGVAMVYPPAAPIAAGVLMADKVLNAVQPSPPPSSPKMVSAMSRVQSAVRAKSGQTAPPALVNQAIVRKLAERRAAGVRTLKNTAELAAKGDKDAARAMTLITKRAAARREALKWKVRGGRVVRV